MLEDFDIIAFTYADWFAIQTTCQHLVRILAEKNRVLYVEMPRSFLHFLKSRNEQNALPRPGPNLQEVQKNVYVFHPPHRFLPVGKLPVWLARLTLHLNGRILARQVNAAARQLGFNKPILWNFSPLHGGAVRRIPYSVLIHDICDEWVNYLKDRAGKRLIEWMDRKLSREADLVFVFSDHMRGRREGLNAELHVVLPAGDVRHYAQASNPELPVPEEMQRLPRPIIGAICVIEQSRFDPGLIEHLGKARPGWSIVLLGPLRKGVDLRRLEGLSNVHVLGNRPLEVLPAYLKGMDVALIPYALNDATRGIYPMKTQEYLAAGKPVVSPRLPACRDLEGVVHFADSHEDFVCKIETALESDSPELQAKRREIAGQNTWRHRLQDRAAHILRVLEAKRGA